MLQLGIVKEILLDEFKMVVRIPILEYTGDREALMVCPICYQPGNTYGYQVEDVVIVGFIDNDYNYPIVLGKMLKQKETTSLNALSGNSLNIDGATVLGTNTKIGEITYDDIFMTVKEFKGMASTIDRLDRSIQHVANDIPESEPTSDIDINSI